MKCYHHNDIDGRSAAAEVATWENNYNPSDYIELDHAKPVPTDIISKNELVYIVDYGFGEDEVHVLDDILKITSNVIWCDHHDSSIKLIKKQPKYGKIKGIRQIGISGVALIHMYLHKKDKLEDCPMFIQLISDFDCWLYKLGEQTEHFRFGLESYDYGALSPIWMFLEGDFHPEYNISNIVSKGKAILPYVQASNKEYLTKFGFECTFEGLKCMAVNKRDNSTIFGDLINEYDIVMTFVNNGSIYSYSIFTIHDDINCEEIAVKNGGGGHKQAAGFTSKELLLKK